MVDELEIPPPGNMTPAEMTFWQFKKQYKFKTLSLRSPEAQEAREQFLSDLGLEGDFFDHWKELGEKVRERMKHLKKQMESVGSDEPDVFLNEINELIAESLPKPHLTGNVPRKPEPKLEHELLLEIKASIEGEKAAATFACGGAIDGHSVAVAFRDSTDAATMHALKFPPENMESSIALLAQACDPASFGFKGEAVLDKSYRSALKLDNDKFVTGFHPYDHGIVNAIQQMLLPSVYTHSTGQKPYIVTELYKLNIYAGPSDMFKAHVDTPRSQNQFGSLVICFPCSHEGGELVVRHNGRSVEFNWGGENPSAIQWAAFYSDCEHEVRQVTAGYRCTITYNLYFDADRLLDTIPRTPLFTVESLPLFSQVRDLFLSSSFMPQGGVLGMCCDHRYAHHDKEGHKHLPAALKGVDAAVYSALSNLSIPVSVRPLYDALWRDGWEKKEMERCIKSFRERDTDKLKLTYYENDGRVEHEEELESFEKRFEALKRRRTVIGWEVELEEVWPNFDPHNCRESTREMGLGRRFTELSHEGYLTEEEYLQTIIRSGAAGSLIDYTAICWLNSPKNKEAAFMNIGYGNEPSIDMSYSWAVILAIIPPYSETRGRS
ncbi:hypothetical protein K440DRAFT_593124 [Wilcoxina mikolae CBS 423.85]|nr:hypothetical protein K440DRAFT_593124 [Wilcoxina mikolae CBS 423.85]